ncbi:hypothetical protein E2562_020302 [Oryza meyeriana var. granulata]|uniref:Uncharacterized protein n=1 Tax=Oryza meyeriana var. granulata TaxID=110450 RepID=A0A6G1DL20_9ORYZ|nr:hypothetical protein E2562_020302 [Oryza meyeriana var. granulata]
MTSPWPVPLLGQNLPHFGLEHAFQGHKWNPAASLAFFPRFPSSPVPSRLPSVANASRLHRYPPPPGICRRDWPLHAMPLAPPALPQGVGPQSPPPCHWD